MAFGPLLAIFVRPPMDALNDPAYFLPFVLANAVALLLFLLAIARARWAFRAYAALFAWSAWMNVSLAWNDPIAYLRFSDLVLWEPYRDLILGPFAPHIQRYMALVSASQLLLAIGLLTPGRLRTLAGIGSVLFFLAVAPLGIGSGFPATLVLAAGMVILLRKHLRMRRLRRGATLPPVQEPMSA